MHVSDDKYYINKFTCIKIRDSRHCYLGKCAIFWISRNKNQVLSVSVVQVELKIMNIHVEKAFS